MPVRARIHSSVVSMTCERSSLVTTCSGTAKPVPSKQARSMEIPGPRRKAGRGGYLHSTRRASQVQHPDQSVDLVTAAHALHWFDIGGFFGEAQRVLVPGGALAVWCYGDPKLDDPLLDAMLYRFNRGTVEEYWPPERDLVLE